MNLSHTTLLVMTLSSAAGAVHVLAPDHWLPASVLAWQKGWSVWRTLFFALGVFTLHVLLGVLAFLGLNHWLLAIDSHWLLGFGVALVSVVMVIRMMRFSRVSEVLRTGRGSIWGALTVMSLLGPCEAVIPILIKAGHLGVGYLLPALSFLGGTVLGGLVLVLSGKVLWNRPMWLPLGLDWARRREVALPVVAVLALGLSALIRLG